MLIIEAVLIESNLHPSDVLSEIIIRKGIFILKLVIGINDRQTNCNR